MATNKQKAHANIGYFLKRYNKAYGSPPVGFNRHSLVYGFEAMAADYPGHEKKIIDFYFDNWDEHSPTYLVFNYGKVVVAMQEAEQDEALRREIRRKTKERMKNVTNSRQSDQGGTP